MKPRYLAFVLCTAAWAQSAVDSPRLGCIREAGGRRQTILGGAGNLILGDWLDRAVVSAACAGEPALLKTADALLELDSSGRLIQRFAAPAGPARFGYRGNGQVALVHYPESSELFQWVGDRLEPLPFRFQNVLALTEAANGNAVVLVEKDSELWLEELDVVAGSGSARRLDIEAATVAITPDRALIYTAGAEIVVRRPARPERRIQVPAPVAGLEPLDHVWIHVRPQAGGAGFLLHLAGSDERLYRLPEHAAER